MRICNIEEGEWVIRVESQVLAVCSDFCKTESSVPIMSVPRLSGNHCRK
jgi:hypothetical protein